jgi:hypothetical protein
VPEKFDKISKFCPKECLGYCELATKSKNKNVRDLNRELNEFEMGYQPRNNLVKDKNGDPLADTHNILSMWKNYFSQLLNVHNVSDVMQIETHS